MTRKTLANILFSALMILAAAFVTLLLLQGAARHRSGQTCAGLRVVFADEFRLVDEDGIKADLEKSYGAFVGQGIDSVKLHRVEKILKGRSAILDAQAYLTPDHMLNVEVRQRRPVMKFITPNGEFYCDRSGFAFPVQGTFDEDIPQMKGAAPLSDRRWMGAVLGITARLPEILAPVNRMEAASDGEIRLHLADGSETVIFGEPYGAAAKIRRLNKYLRDIRPAQGNEWYTSVNVSYRGQVICRKK